MSAYMVPLIFKPTIITAPGQYRTRRGEIVTITEASTLLRFACMGTYSNGTREAWHRSGRLYAGVESRNDIVAKVNQ